MIGILGYGGNKKDVNSPMIIFVISYLYFVRRALPMPFNIGDKVLFNEKEYKVIHIYTSNYCEIREEGRFKTILVHIDEVELVI